MIDYKPPLDVGNIPHDKIPGKTGQENKPKKRGEPNPPKMEVLIEHDSNGQKLLLIPQEDGPNENIGCTFLLPSQ